MMKRSRSRRRSFSRDRALRRLKDRSESLSRNTNRRSSSPVDRRRGSCSRSRSHSRGSDFRSMTRRHHDSKRKKKKVKKWKEKSKDNKVTEQEASEDRGFTAPLKVKNGASNMVPTSAVPVDAWRFFEQLEKQEAAKKPVGTVHSRGLPAPVSSTLNSTSEKWECSKAGCGHVNAKHAPACNKCNAMKRMTEWR